MVTLAQLAGLVGTAAFAVSAVPQTLKCWRDGHAHGVSAGLIALWLIGEFATLLYTIGALNSDPFLVVNYTTNIALVGVIAWFKVFPRGVQ